MDEGCLGTVAPPFSQGYCIGLAGDVMIDIPPAASYSECVPTAIAPDLTKRTSSHVSFSSGYNPEGTIPPAQPHGDLSCRVTPVDAAGVPLAKGEDEMKRPVRSKLADWILGAALHLL